MALGSGTKSHPGGAKLSCPVSGLGLLLAETLPGQEPDFAVGTAAKPGPRQPLSPPTRPSWSLGLSLAHL